ncbi:MAG: RnfH family protein [Hydrogenophilus sp.]|nr:RnfH family protein [Hydrogenophilus sp.]
MNEKEERWIEVTVCYARAPHQVDRWVVRLPIGATVADALVASGVQERFPELDVGGRNQVGINGRVVPLSTPLTKEVRVEIYRPIVADPRRVCRRKAAL